MPSPEQNALKRAAKIIANQAKVISGRFSRRIPATIGISVRGMTASIGAGGKLAPHAGMFERPGARHPTFGHNPWVTQEYKPFLEEAAEEKVDAAMQQFADEIIKLAMKKAGL